jgi:hypothetical protein
VCVNVALLLLNIPPHKMRSPVRACIFYWRLC